MPISALLRLLIDRYLQEGISNLSKLLSGLSGSVGGSNLGSSAITSSVSTVIEGTDLIITLRFSGIPIVVGNHLLPPFPGRDVSVPNVPL